MLTRKEKKNTMNIYPLLCAISRSSPLPFRLKAHHHNQECSKDKQLEPGKKSNTVFEKSTPAQTIHNTSNTNSQDDRELAGLGRKKFRRLSSS